MIKNTENTGKIGELVASRFLKDKGFSVLSRNYRKKWGEIDIIAQKGATLHFVEVKTVSVVSFIDNMGDGYQPEENVHAEKLKRMTRTIQSYLIERGMSDSDWQIDVIGIFLDTEGKKAKVRMTENIIV